jgi:hypothetical protein
MQRLCTKLKISQRSIAAVLCKGPLEKEKTLGCKKCINYKHFYLTKDSCVVKHIPENI